MQHDDPRRGEDAGGHTRGPTQVVESDQGDLIERLSGGTATLLLAWLIGVGALSTLLAGWTFVLLASGERLGVGALFGGFGFYVGLAGAAGPCVLWLAGRARSRPLRWFMVTAVKIALVMLGMLLAVILGAALLMAGALPGFGVLVLVGLMVALSLPLSAVWAVATWAADRWIARARSEGA